MVNMASRSVFVLPLTYSKRAPRLSVTTTLVIGWPPVLEYLRKKVTTSPTLTADLSGHLMMTSGPSGGRAGCGPAMVALIDSVLCKVDLMSRPRTRPTTVVELDRYVP